MVQAIKFYADWSGPCKVYDKVWTKVESELNEKTRVPNFMKKLISILFVLLITFNFFSQQQITKTLFFPFAILYTCSATL